MNKEKFERLLLRTRGLAVLRGVLASSAARDILSLLGLFTVERPESAAVAENFGRLWEELAVEAGVLLPDAWQSHLAGRLLDDENPFSLGAERRELSNTVVGQARRDLNTLQMLFDLDAGTLLSLVETAVPELEGRWTPWRDPEADAGKSRRGEPRRGMVRQLAAAADWGDIVEALIEHYAAHGAGTFGSHKAFRWEDGGLRAVPHPDPVRLSDLIGYEKEREPLRRNTQRLLAGLPSHHALLYGLPGTGKSSTVKAVLNEYATVGLRLVELAKEDLEELPALLEAPIGGPPGNVRSSPPTNRRNLIRERFSDREEGDDVHERDTMQEKLSLVARFGLRLTFPSPDQRRYLGIVSR